MVLFSPLKSHCIFVQQATAKEKEECKTKAKDDELRKLLQTAVSLCVHSGSMTPERAKGYYRSGEIHLCGLVRTTSSGLCCIIECVLYHLSLALDVDLRYALESCPERDMAGRCLIYLHKIINAKGEGDKGHVKKQLQLRLKVKTLFDHGRNLEKAFFYYPHDDGDFFN